MSFAASALAATGLGFLLFLLWFASDGPAWRHDRGRAAASGEMEIELKALERIYARRMGEMRITVVDPWTAAVRAKAEGLSREEAARDLLLGAVASKGHYANVMTDEVLLARVDRHLAWPYAQRFAFLGFATDGGGRGLGVLQPWCVVMPARKGITFGAANEETALAGGLPFAQAPLAVDWIYLLTLHELEHCIEYDERMNDWNFFSSGASDKFFDLAMAGESWADAGAALELLLRGEEAAVGLLADLRALAFARQVAAGTVASVKHFTSAVLWELMADFQSGPPELLPLERQLGLAAEERRRAYIQEVRRKGLERLRAGNFPAAVAQLNREKRAVALGAVAARLVEAGLAPELARPVGVAVARYLAQQRCRETRDVALVLCLDRDSEGSLFWRSLPRRETNLADGKPLL